MVQVVFFLLTLLGVLGVMGLMVLYPLFKTLVGYLEVLRVVSPSERIEGAGEVIPGFGGGKASL